jgi:DNA-binding LacI/PurR family transcriptional regulator
LIDGARKHLAASGHRLTVCGDINGIQSQSSGPKVVASLAARPADGYLVADWLGGLFDQAFTDTGKPWLMFGFAGPVRHQPCMLMDVVESVERATAILLEGGCRRVALIGHLGDKRTCELMSLHHAFAMGFHGAAGYQVSRFVENQALPVRRTLSEMLDSKTPPDGLYVADDTLLPFVAAELQRRGIVPGRDLAVITQWNENQTQAPELPWSRMVYSPRRFGEVLAGNLLATSQSAGVRLSNASILADWCPGETHLLARPATGRGKGCGVA